MSSQRRLRRALDQSRALDQAELRQLKLEKEIDELKLKLKKIEEGIEFRVAEQRAMVRILGESRIEE